ncbi:AraC-like DNA-binding protein [Mumia flava]|uniref:AraC-like DNA-binding protein n=1 Tax=Mumia flava TaxID=1348852 RepID=A0A2M9BII8_9ACTN|nr:AraC-like DNA-binding protein [Mumia flava]
MDRRNATSTSAGILRPEQFARYASLTRVACDPALEPWVENTWHLRWDLPAGTQFVSQTLPHPACTLSVELGHPRAGLPDDRVVVTGVVTRRFDVTLARSGWVLGVKFRPGGLAALAGIDVAGLTDRVVPAAGILPDAVVAGMRLLTDTDEPGAAAAKADRALLGMGDDVRDRSYDVVLRLIDDMLGDRSIVRVSQLEERHGLSTRQIQRLFSRYVGTTPKWVLGRYRMHDVVTALDDGYDGSLADLAAAYGWYDQAHFARDFTALVGVPPSSYRDRG